MRYALVVDSVVTNIIVLLDRTANEFPNAVKTDDRPVAIGDTYEDGKFYRDGVEVLTEVERLQKEIDAYKVALNTLGVQTDEYETEEVLNDAE